MSVLPLSFYLMYGMTWSFFPIDKGKWSPIRLSPSRLTLSHLFFADYLVIFSKAYSRHDRILKDILENFCKVFGHKVNARKTNIFFSKYVKVSMVDMISNMLEFQKV